MYTGRATVCTLDCLHFNTLYSARVRAYNAAGDGPSSDVIGLQTAEGRRSRDVSRCFISSPAAVAFFQLEPLHSHPEMVISNEQLSLCGTSLEYRVALGSIGVSRGVHYWEVTVDRYEANADVVVGIARKCVNKDIMLGTHADAIR